MKKTTWFAGLTLLALIVLTGCGKVRKCTEGEAGCLNGPPKIDGTCAAGLVRKGRLCVEPTGGGPSAGCDCAVDEICAEDGKTCLAYCAEVDNPPQVKRPPRSCTPVVMASDPNPDDYSFDELCAITCEQNCLRAQVLCPGHTCRINDCTSEAARALCRTACPGMDVACMQARCNEIESSTCESFRCPMGSTKNCNDVRCSDTCEGNNADGFCDDGDPQSATYSFCRYGTDCSDCGPRRGPAPERAAIGEVCPGGQDVACEGYNDDFLKTEAWCWRVLEDPSAPFRCVPDCTTAQGEGTCPSDDYVCQAVLNSEGDPFTDATQRQTPGYACIPIVCE